MAIEASRICLLTSSARYCGGNIEVGSIVVVAKGSPWRSAIYKYAHIFCLERQFRVQRQKGLFEMANTLHHDIDT